MSEERKNRTENTQNMTEGSPAGLIFRFAIPVMLGNMFQQVYIMTDTAIVGRAIGMDALAALGSVDWYNYMVLSVIQALTQGFGIRIAQEFGIVCMERSGQDVRKMIRESGFLRNLSACITVVGSEQKYQDVSSSQVREILFRIAQLKHQLNELVPEEIIDLL